MTQSVWEYLERYGGGSTPLYLRRRCEPVDAPDLIRAMVAALSGLGLPPRAAGV